MNPAKGQCGCGRCGYPRCCEGCGDNGGSVGGCCRSSEPHVLPLPSTADQVNRPVFVLVSSMSYKGILKKQEVFHTRVKKAFNRVIGLFIKQNLCDQNIPYF